MKKLLVPWLVVLVALCGCARHYVMKMSNGSRIVTPSKPKLVGNSYHYKDARGQERIVPAGRVTEVAPASVAAEEEKSNQFVPVKPKTSHWYWPF